jgi:branched-chain amino acid transport system ATP-binding protein
MLSVEGIDCRYGDVAVLHGVSLRVGPGEVLGLLGRNGAGKTTTLRAIMGSVQARAGRIRLDGADLTRLPAHVIPTLGVSYVPQGRRLFPYLTVEENLRIGLLTRGAEAGTLTSVLELFPVLRERLRQLAGTLSGGEQQMLATARALCARPRVLLMDEPTEGLMPGLIPRLLETIRALRARGVGVLLVEQRIEAALQVADRVVFMETGRIVHETTPARLAADPEPLLRYVGVRGGPPAARS